MKIHDTPLSLIGNTPLIRLHNIEKKYNLNCKLFAKIEKQNIFGSIKDRIAKAMIDNGFQNGTINENTTIIEPTSGNTGIALSAICAYYKLKLIIVMPESMSIERRRLMSMYGTKIILTSSKDGMKGAIKKAKELNDQINNSIILNQFENEANPQIHFLTTGPEIYNDLDGKIDFFVAGIGTGGSLSGISKYLKSKNNIIKSIGVEPLQSPFLTEGIIKPHKIQGIGPNIQPKTLNLDYVDKILTIDENEALDMVKTLSIEEALVMGISSCANLCACIKIAKENNDKIIVTLFPDSGERYLSIFEN